MKTEYCMKSWHNENSISIFFFHMCKVSVPVATGKITDTFFGDTLYEYQTWSIGIGVYGNRFCLFLFFFTTNIYLSVELIIC